MNTQATNVPASQPFAPNATSDTVVDPGSLEFRPYSVPGSAGDLRGAIVNADAAKAPFIALLRIAPGAELRRHYHKISTEAIYVVDGTLVNAGERLDAGTFLVHGPGTWHGPHTTDVGCTLMFIQHPAVGPDDTVFE